MATYSDSDFVAKLDSAVPTNSTPASQSAPSAPASDQSFLDKLNALTPQTNAALASSVNAPPTSLAASYQPDFLTRNERPGIALDLATGLPSASDYWQIAEQRGPEAQLARAQQLYPKSNARILESGDIAVEVNDSKTGKPKDVTINPAGIDAHDLIDLAVQTPELAAGLAGFLATKGRGTLRTAAAMIASAVTGQAAGAVRDVVARRSAGIPIDPEEIKSARSKQAAIDLLLQTGGAGVGKVGGMILSPFANQGRRVFNPEAAQAFFQKWFGEDIKMLPGETTGSPLLQKIESFESKMPGAQTWVSRFKQSGADAVDRIIQAARGPIESDEEIGIGIQQSLEKQVSMPVEMALDDARATLELKGQSQLLSTFDKVTKRGGKVTPSAPGITSTAAGTELRAARDAAFDSADKATKDAYAEVAKFPEAKQPLIPSGNDVYAAAQAIRKEIPNVQQISEEVGYDSYGSPVVRAKTVARELKSAVPEGLETTLRDMEAQKGQKMSLDALTKLKNAAYDEIAKTKAVPGLKERWFNIVAEAYDASIQRGVDATGNANLKIALQKAKDTYKSRMLPFERQGLRDIPIPNAESGYKSEEALTHRLFRGEEAQANYRALQSALGPKNPVFKTLNRSLLDGWLAEATDDLTSKINPEQMLSRFTEFRKTQPDTFKAIFGDKGKDVEAALRGIKAARAPDLDMGEVQGLINSGRLDKTSLNNLVLATQERNLAYINSLVEASKRGIPIGGRIKPLLFAQRLLSNDTAPSDIKVVVDALANENPEKRQALAAATFYDVITRASDVEAGNLTKLSQKKIESILGARGSTQRQRYEMLLGGDPIPMFAGNATTPPIIGAPTRMDVLENIVNILGPRQDAEKTFAAAGGQAAGREISTALNAPLKYAAMYARKLFISMAYTSDLGLRITKNRAIGPEESAIIVQTMIASEPFARRLVEMGIGTEKARQVVANLRTAVNHFVDDIQGQRATVTTERDKFLQGKPSQFKMEPAQYPPRNGFSIRPQP